MNRQNNLRQSRSITSYSQLQAKQQHSWSVSQSSSHSSPVKLLNTNPGLRSSSGSISGSFSGRGSTIRGSVNRKRGVHLVSGVHLDNSFLTSYRMSTLDDCQVAKKQSNTNLNRLDRNTIQIHSTTVVLFDQLRMTTLLRLACCQKGRLETSLVKVQIGLAKVTTPHI